MDEFIIESENSSISDNEDVEIDDESIIRPTGHNNGDRQETELPPYLGKDKSTLWQETNRERRGPISSKNIFTAKPGLSYRCKRSISSDDVFSAFHLLFDNYIVNHIHACTITEANRQKPDSEWSFSKEELLAVIGIMYIRGATSASKFDLEALWSDKWGIPIVQNTMSRNRFREIIGFLRFDEKTSRRSRVLSDKFCLIRDIWKRMIDNSQDMYTPKEFLTIDEQLLPSKCRCPFTQYMPNKPDKFGIKFWVLCDTETKYVLNSLPYLGKEESRPSNVTLSEYVVCELVKPYKKLGYNITCDNYFTSLSLASALEEQKITMVGTIRKNRRELPEKLPQMEKDMMRYESRFFLNSNKKCSLTVYKSKSEKSVCVLSSMHESCTFGGGPKNLPETVNFYNKTKHGVDMFDSMTRMYSTKAGSRRWPMHVFYNLLDIVALNSWIIYKIACQKSISRRDYLLFLGERMCQIFKPFEVNLPASVSESPARTALKRKECQISKHKNKGGNVCSTCKKWCCGPCSANKIIIVTCINCAK